MTLTSYAWKQWLPICVGSAILVSITVYLAQTYVWLWIVAGAIATATLAGNSSAEDMIIQPDGKIVVVGAAAIECAAPGARAVRAGRRPRQAAGCGFGSPGRRLRAVLRDGGTDAQQGRSAGRAGLSVRALRGAFRRRTDAADPRRVLAVPG